MSHSRLSVQVTVLADIGNGEGLSSAHSMGSHPAKRGDVLLAIKDIMRDSDVQNNAKFAHIRDIEAREYERFLGTSCV